MGTGQRRQSAEKWQVSKATEATTKVAKATVKVAAKTSRQAQAEKASDTAVISVSMRVTVVDCEMGNATRTASLRLIPVYNVKGNIVGMSQVPVTSLLAPVMPDMSRGKAAQQAMCKNLGASIIEELEERSSDSSSKYDSDSEV